MTTPKKVMEGSSALLNDQDRAVYTDSVLLPYFNTALEELSEIFEENNIPVTNETSSVIPVKAGLTQISPLPSDMIEIRQLWERPKDINPFVKMGRRDFIPHDMEGQSYNQFMIWALVGDVIKVPKSTQDNDVKIDYIRNIYPEVDSNMLNIQLSGRNIKLYLQYRTAALAALYIGENQSRHDSLTSYAFNSLDRSLGISVKSGQSIPTRRLPFRYSYKRRGLIS